ncbi:hypothetical protein GGE66_001946 [Rhizobium leguminosarum]|uniref:Uncharacterized protein n=1 Tax=Rhizobium leguminosarum TaxID=384 RepID=A0A7W9ZRP7_RHILE|nr:hypothetical protein [Rhizobium leguminosarum]
MQSKARPSSGCRHLLPVNGAKGYAATFPFLTNVSQRTSSVRLG